MLYNDPLCQSCCQPQSERPALLAWNGWMNRLMVHMGMLCFFCHYYQSKYSFVCSWPHIKKCALLCGKDSVNRQKTLGSCFLFIIMFACLSVPLSCQLLSWWAVIIYGRRMVEKGGHIMWVQGFVQLMLISIKMHHPCLNVITNSIISSHFFI